MLNEKRKLNFIIGITSFLVFAISLRLVYLKVIDYEKYAKISNSQSNRILSLKKGRGLIYDSAGNLLTENIKVASIYIRSEDVKDLYKLKAALRKYGIKLSQKAIDKIKENSGFVWIKRRINLNTAEKIHKAVNTIHYVTEENRFYPEHKLAAGIVGFTGIDNQGLYGVEKRLDKILAGQDVKLLTNIDRRGKLILTEDTRTFDKPSQKVILSIDTNLEFIANLILKEDARKFKPERAGVLGIDVNTGEILFSSFLPEYDPNYYYKYNRKLWKEASTHYIFEPGSIFKPVTFSYLYDRGLTLNKKVYCEKGRYKVYDIYFNDVHKYETLTAEEVLVLSSNIGTIKLNKKTPKKDFYEYLKTAGFGKTSGVTGLHEEAGILHNYKKWSGTDKPSISIGQAISVTPLQIVRFYAAIANGGTLMTPVLIKDAGDKIKIKKEKRQIMSKKTADILANILRKVVLKGTGKQAQSKFINIAGKTGTAQKTIKGKSGYSSNKYVASFAGFFPADNPKIAMIVIYDSPKESIYGKRSIYGGTTAAVTFKKIAEQISILNGYNVKKVYLANAN